MNPTDLITRLHVSAEVASSADLKPLAGRHILLGSCDKLGPVRVELRIDPEHDLVSGDVFETPEPDAPQRNADWRFSFQSEAHFTCDGSVAAICTLSRDERYPEPLAAGAKVLVYAEKHAQPGFAQCVGQAHILVLNEATEARPIPTAILARSVDQVTGATAPAHDKAFRQIRLDLFTDLASRSPRYNAWRREILTGAVFGTGQRSGIKEVLAQAGIRLDVSHTLHPLDNAEPADTLAEVSAHFSPAQFSSAPWHMSILISSLCNPEGGAKRPSLKVPYGRTLGLEAGVARGRTRFGAVVFADEVIQAYARHKKLNDDALFLPEHTEVLMRRLQFTFLHELGHLLNLPHTWQRDRFLGPAMPSNPSEKSVLAYGSKYPMGILHDHALRHVTRDEDESALDTAVFDYSLQNMERGLADPGFPPLEQRHIRHAPFPTIGVGETSFLDDPADQPRIIRLWHAQKRLHLNLDNGAPSASDADGPGAQALRLRTYRSGNRLNRIEPPTGQVTLTGPALRDLQKNGVDADTAMFGFLGGALKLLVREDPPDRRDPMAAAKIFDMPALPIVHPFEKGLSPLKTAHVSGAGFAAPIPFLSPEYIHGLTTTGRFTLQVVYVAPDRTELRSEPVHVTVDYKDLQPRLPNCVKDILANPHLSLVSELPHFASATGMTTLFGDLDLSDLERGAMEALVEELNAPALGSVLAQRDATDLLWLAEIRDRIGLYHPGLSAGQSGQSTLPVHVRNGQSAWQNVVLCQLLRQVRVSEQLVDDIQF